MNQEQRQDLVKFIAKTLCFYGAYLVIEFIVTNVLVKSILGTICFAIFGEEEGLIAANILLRILAPLLTIAIVIPGKIKDKTAEREYLKSMENKEFDMRIDIFDILKSSTFCIENIAYTIVVLILACRAIGMIWAVLIPIPIFYVVNLVLTSFLHRKWLAGRLHR